MKQCFERKYRKKPHSNMGKIKFFMHSIKEILVSEFKAKTYNSFRWTVKKMKREDKF